MNHILKTETAKDGNPIPIVNDFILHSKYSPFKEGEQICKAQLNQTKRKKNLVVFGLGFAYHILPVADQYQNLWVVESIKELIQIAKEQKHLEGIIDRFQFITDLNEAQYIEDADFLKLNSENRFQEKFFNEVLHQIQTPVNRQEIKPSDLRVLVDFPIYGGSYTTARYVANAFQRLGCSVEIMDNSMANDLFQHILSMKNYMNESAERLTDLLAEIIWQKYLEFKPHIVFCMAQAPVNRNLIKAIQKAGSLVAFWFVEDFRRFPYWKEVCKDTDLFFVIQQGEFFNLLHDHTHSAYAYLPVAADELLHHRIVMNHDDYKLYGSDVSFMGASFPNRVNFFNQLTDLNLKLWGTGWEEYPRFNKHNPLPGKRISMEESVKIYNATKININLHSSMNEDLFDPYGDFINPRTFEICACGGFQMVDRRPPVQELFKEDEEIVMFSGVDEALDKIHFYLKHEDLRKKIALKGQERVIKQHTYTHRMQDVIYTLISSSSLINFKVSEEKQKIDHLLKAIKDKEFEAFINQLSSSEKNNFEFILNKVKDNQGKFRDYEVALLLLETFYRGE